jgi:hypothetical protein
MNTQIIALNPSELGVAQSSLIGWCEKKIAEWDVDLKLHTEALEYAIANKWNVEGHRKAVNKAAGKIKFYHKIKAAIEAGYILVPNFPLDIFAIRTNRKNPSGKPTERSWDNFDQKAGALPVGEGRFVSATPTKDSYDEERKNKDGTTKEVTMYYPEELQEEIEIPMSLVRPEIMRAVDIARAQLIFDSIGVSTDQRGDPIICGQIHEASAWSSKRLTFFLAWYVDLNDI